MPVKRSYCSICAYPQSVCICHAVERLQCPLNIIVLQHPAESKHAKNSARLLPLCLDKVQICIGESPNDFWAVAKACHSAPEEFAVFYPSDCSNALEQHVSQFKQDMPGTFIFIDATWRKALKIWKLNPWLDNLNCWHFTTPPCSRYHIRKVAMKTGLSTLEAVAYALEQTKKIDCQPLLNVFYGMQKIVFKQQFYPQTDYQDKQTTSL
jgi:DTW domain-containing protein YfiP